MKWRRPRNLKGLGDVVALAAQPVARLIDSVAGTSISGCQGCQNRQEKLNQILPFKSYGIDKTPPKL